MQIEITTLWLELPGGAFLLTHDKTAQEILLEKGYIGTLHAKNSNQNFSSVTWQSDDAYFVATHQSGHLMPEDNGYAIFCFPKQYFTAQAFIECMGAVLGDELRNVTTLQVDERLPQNN